MELRVKKRNSGRRTPGPTSESGGILPAGGIRANSDC
jgi:hypothetical protein